MRKSLLCRTLDGTSKGIDNGDLLNFEIQFLFSTLFSQGHFEPKVFKQQCN